MTGSGWPGNQAAWEGDWNATGVRPRPPLAVTVPAVTAELPAADTPSGARPREPVAVFSGTVVNTARTAAQPVWFTLVENVPVTVWVPEFSPARLYPA